MSLTDAEVLGRVLAVLERLERLEVDHRHADEAGAASPFGVDGRAYYYAGDVVDAIYDLRLALGIPENDHTPIREHAARLSPRVCTDPDCTIPRKPGRPMHGPHDFRARTGVVES